MEFVADRLQSNYKAVLLSRSSEELSVVAEGIGTEIVRAYWLRPPTANSSG
jgi:hypothetical protein